MIKKQLVFMYVGAGVIERECTWVRAELEVNSNPKRLLDTRLHSLALTIIDANGFFIKPPPKNIIGGTNRVFTTGIYWLNKTCRHLTDTQLNLISPKRTLETLNLKSEREYVSFVSANSPYDAPPFTRFLKEVLPKGQPSTII